VPIARYFIFVGATLAALLLIADWCLPTPPAMFAKQLVIDKSIIRIKSAHKWPERIVLDTSQPTITALAVAEPPATQSVRLSPDEARDQSNLQALALWKPDTPSAAADHPALRIKRGLAGVARPQRVARGPATRRLARTEAGGAVVSLDGSTMLKQARMPCCEGTSRPHGRWIGRRSPEGIERQTAAVVAHGTAQ
jgi:hypothetical protein